MWSRETVPAGSAHEALFEGASGVDPEISQDGADGAGGASCARPDPANRDGARDQHTFGKSGQRPHSRAGCLSTPRGYQQDGAMAERDQFADIASRVRALEES